MTNYCKYYNQQGRCNLAEEKGFTYVCRVKGDYNICKNGVKEEVLPEAPGQEIIAK